MRWSAYLHPAAMLLVLTLGIFVLREGLRLRRARLVGRTRDTRRHRLLARIFVLLALVGFGSGLGSLGWIRGEPLFGSVHWRFVLPAGLSLVLAGVLGLRLERSAAAEPDAALLAIHALAGGLGMLLALAAALAGFAILP